MSILIFIYAICCLFSGFILYKWTKYEIEINGADLRISDLFFMLFYTFTPLVNIVPLLVMLTDEEERYKVFPKSPDNVGLIDRIKRLNIVVIKGKK